MHSFNNLEFGVIKSRTGLNNFAMFVSYWWESTGAIAAVAPD
jgi:hypothetical protein